MSESDSIVVIADGHTQSGIPASRTRSHSITPADDIIILDSPTVVDTSRSRRQRRRRQARAINAGSIVDLTCNSSVTDLVDLTSSLDSNPLDTSTTPDLSIVDLSDVSSSVTSTKKQRVDTSLKQQGTPQRDAPSILRLNCPVCLVSLQDLLKKGKELRSTVCGHVFCHICIKTAIRSSKKCPTCRKKLTEKQIHPLYLPIG